MLYFAQSSRETSMLHFARLHVVKRTLMLQFPECRCSQEQQYRIWTKSSKGRQYEINRLDKTLPRQPTCKESIHATKNRGLGISSGIEWTLQRKYCHPGTIDSDTAPKNTPNPKGDYNDCKRYYEYKSKVIQRTGRFQG